jgi:hypothetical protein
MRDYYINSQQTFHYITPKVIAPFYNRYKASLLTDFYCLGSAELALDEAVLKFPAEVGHAEFRRVEGDVGVAFVETGLNPDLKVFMQIMFRYQNIWRSHRHPHQGIYRGGRIGRTDLLVLTCSGQLLLILKT